MNIEKLQELLKNIKACRYGTKEMGNVNAFRGLLERDLNIDGNEALALLGYLLAGDYVIIDHKRGLMVNPSSPDIRQLIKEGKL